MSKEDWKDLITFATVMILAVSVLFGSLVGLQLWANSAICETHSEKTGAPTDFEVFGGCYVQHEGRMVRIDDYKYIELMERGE